MEAPSLLNPWPGMGNVRAHHRRGTCGLSKQVPGSHKTWASFQASSRALRNSEKYIREQMGAGGRWN